MKIIERTKRRYAVRIEHPDYQPLPDAVWELMLPDIFSWHARRQPDTLAVADAEGAFTYAELDQASNRVAHAILEHFPNQEDLVPVLAGARASVAVGLLAALKAGRVFAGIEPSFPASQLTQIMALLRPPAVFARASLMGLAGELGRPALDLDEIITGDRYPSTPPDVPLTMEGDFSIVFTSGSTGASKGVGIGKAGRHEGGRSLSEKMQVGPHDRVAHLGNPNYAGGQGSLLFSLLTGASHYLYDSQTQGLARFGQWLEENGITIITSTPPLFRQYAPSLAGARLDRLRLVKAGADRLTRADHDLFRKYFPPTCYMGTGFASSEAGGLASIYFRPGDEFDSDQLPAGYVNPEAEVYIWDEDGRPLPNGEVGEIVAYTPRMSSGYLGNETLNREKFVPHPTNPARLLCRTGDLGWLTDEGLLYVAGRKDFQVKLRGMVVNMQEVSAALQMHPQLREAAVNAHSDSQGSKRLVAYAACEPPHPGLRELRDFLARDLAPFKIPAYFIFLDTLPKLPNGKVNFKALPTPDGQRPALSAEYVAPRSQLERDLAAIWEETLDLRPLGVDDNFHELGGDSLQAARIFIEIHRRLGHYLAPAVLYTSATIAALASAIESDSHDEMNRTFLVPIQQGTGQPPFVFFVTPQRGDVMGYHDIIRHLPPDLTLYGFNSWTMAQQEWNAATLTDLAARYVAEIERVAGRAPVILGGHSLGGLIAYEMASQLLGRGIEVRLLFMMDTSGPGYVGNSLFSMSFKYLKKHVAAMNTRERIQFVVRRLRGLPGYGRRLANIVATRLGRAPVQQVDRFPVGRSFRGAYTPPSLAAPVLFFRSTADRIESRFDDSRGWSDVLNGNLSIQFIPGDHFTHLLEAGGAEIARHLASAIHSAQAAQAG